MFDKSGAYTVTEAGVYEVASASVARYNAIVSACRDLESAHAMVEQCRREDLEGLHPLLEQSFWIAAIIQYGKPFTTNNARKHFNAGDFVRSRAGSEMRDCHHYLITLRDKMVAHDDGLGECTQLAVFLPDRAPAHEGEIGIEPPKPRIVSLGTDIAREVEPHFRAMHQLFVECRNEARGVTLKQLLQGSSNDVKLLRPEKPAVLEVDFASVLTRWPR